MRSKFLRFGADAFEAHELLEMLLYHSITQKDTNQTAHLLIDNSGSLEKVLNTAPNKLQDTDGIGEKSAVLISLASAAARKAELEAAASCPLDSEYRRCRYLHSWYKGKPPGTVAAFMLDSKMHLIENVTLSSGRMFRPKSYCDSITAAAGHCKAVNVILSHSHENGVRVPSVEDVFLTGAIRSALALIEVSLTEHYIVTENDCTACSSTAPDCTVK